MNADKSARRWYVIQASDEAGVCAIYFLAEIGDVPLLISHEVVRHAVRRSGLRAIEMPGLLPLEAATVGSNEEGDWPDCPRVEWSRLVAGLGPEEVAAVAMYKEK